MNTPKNITKLEANQVFVFGSNMNGSHAGGAARTALEKFGAIQGQAIGLQGQSYAIPTLDKDMNKMDIRDIANYVQEFRYFAEQNEDKLFLVTLIGCGIAGFDVEDIAPIFRGCINQVNIVLPEEFHKIQGFKGFNSQDGKMVCRDMVYAENTLYKEDVVPEICDKGLHFCQMPLDVLGYYPPVNGTVYSQVESQGMISVGEDKVATNELRVKGKISLSALFKFHFDTVFNRVKKTVFASKETVTTAGYKAHANTAGYKAHANTAGREAHANTAGREAHANTAGDYAHANTAGDYAHANTAGYKAHANTAGDYAHANTAGYKAHANVKGSNSVAVSLGIEGTASGAKGCWIVLSEWQKDSDNNWTIKEVKAVLVDGIEIKENEVYKLVNGKVVKQ